MEQFVIACAGEVSPATSLGEGRCTQWVRRAGCHGLLRWGRTTGIVRRTWAPVYAHPQGRLGARVALRANPWHPEDTPSDPPAADRLPRGAGKARRKDPLHPDLSGHLPRRDGGGEWDEEGGGEGHGVGSLYTFSGVWVGRSDSFWIWFTVHSIRMNQITPTTNAVPRRIQSSLVRTLKSLVHAP